MAFLYDPRSHGCRGFTLYQLYGSYRVPTKLVQSPKGAGHGNCFFGRWMWFYYFVALGAARNRNGRLATNKCDDCYYFTRRVGPSKRDFPAPTADGSGP